MSLTQFMPVGGVAVVGAAKGMAGTAGGAGMACSADEPVGISVRETGSEGGAG